MATLTYSSRAQHHTGLLDNALRTFRAFFQGVREGLEMSDRYHALSRMSDADLAKRGLTRSEITRAVVLGTDRR
jgi:uncharacterized protein YjiS (DUF1127 family)